MLRTMARSLGSPCRVPDGYFEQGNTGYKVGVVTDKQIQSWISLTTTGRPTHEKRSDDVLIHSQFIIELSPYPYQSRSIFPCTVYLQV
jgi:hypothetical protein